MNLFKTLRRILLPADLNSVFSEEGKEKTALGVAARFSRGNVGVQNRRITTDRKFADEMRRMEQRVSRNHNHSPSS